jgi:hypothetical protein
MVARHLKNISNSAALAAVDISARKNCAQIVPKICQRYRNVSNNIDRYRNPGAPTKRPIAGELLYFLHCAFFEGRLHTVEVRGSNPPSPILLLSKTCAIPRPGKAKNKILIFNLVSDDDTAYPNSSAILLRPDTY